MNDGERQEVAASLAHDMLEAMAKEQMLEDRYASLRRVLDDALWQASTEKGEERHGSQMPEAPFEDQPMMIVRRAFGSGFTLGQVAKKILEARTLPSAKAIHELRGAIVYLAGEILALERSV